MAASLNGLGKDVTMIFPETAIGSRILPPEISNYLNQLFRERGIRVLSGQLVDQLESGSDKVTVHTDAGEEWVVDGVVAGLGICPNVQLAREAGIEVGDGIIVNPQLQTSHPDVFAAGDVISFYNPTLDRRMRVEHEENANLSGMIAGKGMAGQPEAYTTLPAVYSTLFEISYDAVGDLNPHLQIVYDWQEPFQKGTVYYLESDRVRGVLLWNQSRGLEQARQLIAQPGPIRPRDLKGFFSGD